MRLTLARIAVGPFALVAACLLALAVGASAHAQCGGNATLVPGGAVDGGLLGERVAVRGGEVFVGAPGVGRTYVYRRQTGATPYAAVGQLTRPATVDGGDEFGRALAVDMDVCAVGAPYWSDGKGAVALYKRNAAGTWSFLQLLTAPVQQPNLFFGTALAAEQGFLLVGAPGGLNGGNFNTGIAYLYVRQPDGTYAYNRAFTPSQPTAQVDGQFGQCVGMSQGTIIIGAPGELYAGDTRRGSLYVFQRNTNGNWPLIVRQKSANASNTTLAYAVDCAIDGAFVAVREQSSTPGTSDTLWMYSLISGGLSLEPSFTAGESENFAFDPGIDSLLVGTVSIRNGYLACGSRSANRVDLYARGAGQWQLQQPYTSGSAGDVQLGAGVALGHDILAMGMPLWEPTTNYEPGALWALAHVTRNCDADSDSDACEAMSQANSAFDDDFDGVPDNCESTVSPSAALGTQGTVAGGVLVTWRQVPSAIGYRVQRQLGGSTVVAGWPYAAEFVDTGAAPDTLYTYLIRSVDGANGFGPGNVQTTGWRPYDAPEDLEASDGTSGAAVELTWTAVPGAPAYRVFRAVGNGAETEIAQTTAPQYSDTTASAGVVYTYWVTVKGNLGDSLSSFGDTGFRAAINVPGNVLASDGSSTTSVEITWDSVAAATGYRIYRAPTGSALVEVASVGGGTLSLSDTSAAPLVGYSYAVAAVVNGVVGTQSSPDTGWRNLPAPTGVSASDGTLSSSVTVTWTPVPGATGYTIWRGTTDHGFSQIGSVGAGVASYDDGSVPAGVVHYYQLRATHGLGASGPSTFDTGWRNLDAPAGVAASDGAYADRIRVTWSAVSGATGYRVLRLLPGGSETPLPDLPAGTTQFDDTGTGSLDSVRYRVRALSVAGSTFPSAADFGWRNVPAPAGVMASDGAFDSRVVVSWSAVPQATGYRVMRSVSGGAWTEVAVARPEDSSAEDRSAPALQTCSYQVAALHALGETAMSANDFGWRNLRAPVARATDGTSSLGVQVEWEIPAAATGFEVYAGSAPDALALVVSVNANTSSWRDTQVAAGVKRHYAVRTKHALGGTSVGNPDLGWRGLPAPQEILASDGTYKSHVQVQWKTVQGAVAYAVQRRLSGTHDEFVTVMTVTSSPAQDKLATPSVRYDYTVAAVAPLGVCGAGLADMGWRSGGADSTGSGSGAPPAFLAGEADSDGTGDGTEGGEATQGEGVVAGDGRTMDAVAPTRVAESSGDAGAREAGRSRGELVLLEPAYFDQGALFPAQARVTLVLRDARAAERNGAVVAAGAIRMAGSLRVAVARGTPVRAGDGWVLCWGESLEGAFDSVELPTAPHGITWRLEQRGGVLVLRAE